MEDKARQDIIDAYKYKLISQLLSRCNIEKDGEMPFSMTVQGIIDFIQNDGFRK